MANATPSRLGQANAAGDPLALFLKVFAGEVLTAFDRESAFRPRHMVRTIGSAASRRSSRSRASPRQPTTLPARRSRAARSGTASASSPLTTCSFPRPSSPTSTSDEPLRCPLDLLGTRSAQALAQGLRPQRGRTGITNARGAAVVTGLRAVAADGRWLRTRWHQALAGHVQRGRHARSERHPAGDRYGFLSPVQYALVVMSEKPINRDLNGPQRCDQGIQGGEVERINNIVLVKTNNLPSADDSANLNIPPIGATTTR
jgi:hypothetical protein